MSAISDALDIDHFTCAKGASVERSFLEAVAGGLGFDGGRRRFRNKGLLLSAIIQKSTGRPPAKVALKGGTVTDEALENVLKGIQANGLAKVSLTRGAAAGRIATTLYEQDGAPGVFDPLDLSDVRKWSLREVVVRGGQASFRDRALRAYGGTCSITGCSVPEVLDAAHIRPYKGTRSNVASNGILLRVDLHRLWDRGLMAVHESTLEVLFAPKLVHTEYGATWGGTKMRLPIEASKQPSTLALEQQRTWAGL
ncbi:HNH endonuclease [Isoptericola cucumis]|nr:HNH endonuclease [Isoptericola cucumis]